MARRLWWHWPRCRGLNVERRICTPRANWPAIIESQGMHYHADEGLEFWDESACYAFSSAEIDLIEEATYALNDMCLAAVDRLSADRTFDALGIPPTCADLICDSWQRDELTVYGRFDLAYDGSGPPRLLEYNADTPTALLEAAVIQWFWLRDVMPDLDQFNRLHERLIEAWRSDASLAGERIHFVAGSSSLEDYMTISYLRDTAMQAGLETESLPIEQVGWNTLRECFVDLEEREMRRVFKLYPWEWMVREPFGPYLASAATRWLEPPWKMLLSNKAILPVLWEMFPESPYLLEASFMPLAGDYVRKPFFSREGANVQIVRGGTPIIETDGEYGGPYVYQRHVPLRTFAGQTAVVGSWMINGHAAGIGIREDDSPVTRNTSRFIPHVFTKE